MRSNIYNPAGRWIRPRSGAQPALRDPNWWMRPLLALGRRARPTLLDLGQQRSELERKAVLDHHALYLDVSGTFRFREAASPGAIALSLLQLLGLDTNEAQQVAHGPETLASAELREVDGAPGHVGGDLRLGRLPTRRRWIGRHVARVLTFDAGVATARFCYVPSMPAWMPELAADNLVAATGA